LRRYLVTFVALVAALTAVLPTAASLQPIRRDFGELTLPRLRAGTIKVPAGHADGRVRVIVRLKQPPLAAVFGRSGKSAISHRLDVSSRSSRAYLAKIRALQSAAAGQLRRAIPSIRLSRRFQILLDGITVSVRTRDLPRLVRIPFVNRVYPSLTYTLDTNESPQIIQADALHRRTGALGDGVKIAVVDTGIDQTNPFLSPDGMSYPPGFPKGGKRWTTPKVIVVRAFPGPGSGREGRIGGDPGFPHGTHVSGIAAGRAGTDAPPSSAHPQVRDLSGVAPRAWLGAYRVFTIPTPLGESANTPEIVAAFEAAVRDGMDVINFSGGGPEIDPANDAMIETVTNVSAAGVVPVISAGNDRDDFGLGTDGTPGTAPDAITVAAVTNNHVFTPSLTLQSPSLPGVPREIPLQRAIAPGIPNSWALVSQPIVDIGTIVGREGTGVDRHLCGQPDDPNGTYNPLPAGSLTGSIALVSRGYCSFVSKVERVKEAGGIGMVLVNNRAGTPSGIPVETAVPSGMISDLDGQRLRNALATSLGRGQVRIDTAIRQIQTDRGGVVTFFSSAGPTAFGHRLKPDVAAPGGDILSSVTKALDPSQFSVFDGTSMAAPHVTGAAALLVQLHPSWTPQQIKSALMTTAGPAWQDTAKTQEAPVTLQGAGLIDVDKAADPLVFTDPGSISLGDLNANRGKIEKSQLVVVSDAAGGAGTWQVELAPQAATAGATIEVPNAIDLAPGGNAAVPLIATASAGAIAGENYGFVVLRRGAETRRIPYLFVVTRPAFEGAAAKKLQVWQEGTTRFGASRANVYAYPQWAFGPPPGYTDEAPMNEGGAEKLYTTLVKKTIVNLGVAVIQRSSNSLIDPFFLGSPDQNDVQGYAGTPVNVNAYMFDFHFDLGVAGVSFPRQKRFWVAVDSGSDSFTGEQLPGRYLLKMWRNDVTPPAVRLITTRVSAGRPLLAARVLDSQSGVDPFSLVIGYRRVLVGAAAYDPLTGLVLFPLPRLAPRIKTGTIRAIIQAADNQEAKNVASIGNNPLPNTAFRAVRITGVNGPAVAWLVPEAGVCVRGRVRLGVAASSTAPVVSVRFFDRKQLIKKVTQGPGGLFVADWRTSKAGTGRHTLRATALDRKGRSFSAVRRLRVCR
jgi:minor extracellular serine protease Vpr